MEKDYFSFSLVFGPCSRNDKNLTLKKKKRSMYRRDPVSCSDSGLVTVVLRTEVVFMREAATFWSLSSISVVKDLRQEVETFRVELEKK